MKLKTLAAITLVLLGCSFASAQTFSFFDANGYEFCDYIVITYNSGGVVAGYDDLEACGLDYNAEGGIDIPLREGAAPSGVAR